MMWSRCLAVPAVAACRRSAARVRALGGFSAAVLPLQILLCFSVPVVADDAWMDRARKPGTKVVVMEVAGRLHRGRVLEWNPQSVILKTDTTAVTIPREDVAVIRAAGPFDGFHTIYAPWENLDRLPSQLKVWVYRTDALPVNGVLLETGEDSITVDSFDKTRRIERRRITKVRAFLKSHRNEGAQVGAAIGFFAVLAAMAGAASQGQSMDGAGEVLDFIVGASGKAGEGVGTLFDEYQTVYVTARR
jgi:hypothetical protein